jgi:hypothetical protein
VYSKFQFLQKNLNSWGKSVKIYNLFQSQSKSVIYLLRQNDNFIGIIKVLHVWYDINIDKVSNGIEKGLTRTSSVKLTQYCTIKKKTCVKIYKNCKLFQVKVRALFTYLGKMIT